MRPAGAYAKVTWLRAAALLSFFWIPCQAAAETLPDTSNWRSYRADAYGVAIKALPYWRLDDTSLQRGAVLSLRTPYRPDELRAGYGIKAFTLG